MPISIACISHQLLLLEGIEASVAGSEFDASLVRFQGRLMLDELALDTPRLLLLDGGCPKFSALVLVDRLKRALPQAQLMVYLRSIRAVECQSLLSMGVMGLVDTSVSGVDLLQGLRKVVRRDVHLSVKVAQALALSRFCSDNPFDRLSARELTVCDLVVDGIRAPDIAEQLCLSAKTVNTYRYRIFEKLGINSDVELTHLAYNHGMKGVESKDGRI